jgi:cullin 4
LRDVDSSATSLVRVGDCWSLYCSQLLHIRNIFLVLDRRLHSDSAQTCRSIEELGVHLFKKHWQLHPSLVQNVLSGCLATIRAERTGQLIDRQLLRRLLSMLVSLGCFHSEFKPLLIADLERFFAEESARMLCDSEVSVFLLYCERRLKDEAENLGAVMPASDCTDLIRTVQRVLLEVNIDAILSTGLSALIDSSRCQGCCCAHFYHTNLLVTPGRPFSHSFAAGISGRSCSVARALCRPHQSIWAAACAGAAASTRCSCVASL